jgi:hypothetical protein
MGRQPWWTRVDRSDCEVRQVVARLTMHGVRHRMYVNTACLFRSSHACNKRCHRPQ